MLKFILETINEISGKLGDNDDLILLTIAYVSLAKVCDRNCLEKDENGKLIHPCKADCPISQIFHCTELADLKDRVVNDWKIRAEKSTHI